MIRTQPDLTPAALRPKVQRMFELSAAKIRSIENSWAPSQGSPVITAGGRYISRGWTEWTQGFQFGSAILQFDATGEREFLETGRERTVRLMAPHVTHTGVHDHGFNNVSTYGSLLRLMAEGRIPENDWERRFYELALECSGAVQAARWSRTADGGGYIYSFNGPHSLFVDTIRSLRALVVSHRLGHALMAENDRRISLLERAMDHARATARYSVYYGEGRDAFDVRGRVAHESIFNVNDGQYRCPNSQQGYSPFSTWTRGLAWAMCGFAELLEFLDTEPEQAGGLETLEKAARATCDFYIENTPPDGIPYWDTGAPGLAQLGNWRGRPADPWNPHEPVDSSAAAIAAQGLLRLGKRSGEERYWQAGMAVASALFDDPYLSRDPAHQGLILHSVYHRPNGWAAGAGESSMWGDYHARELGLYLLRLAENGPYLKFWV
ncbi:MAG TPA: glycosyl hydrolase [Bryobacteraceae bacterium]|nr:glycosyl hydrolase [Bryobacteraceae bacterium]